MLLPSFVCPPAFNRASFFTTFHAEWPWEWQTHRHTSFHFISWLYIMISSFWFGHRPKSDLNLSSPTQQIKKKKKKKKRKKHTKQRGGTAKICFLDELSSLVARLDSAACPVIIRTRILRVPTATCRYIEHADWAPWRGLWFIILTSVNC